MQKIRRNKQQAGINIVSYIVGIIFTIAFVSGYTYIIGSLGKYIEKESADDPSGHAYIMYLLLKWPVIIIGVIVIFICIYRLVKAVIILKSKDDIGEVFNNYYAEEAMEKKYTETITFIGRDIRYIKYITPQKNGTGNECGYYVKGITASNYIIETRVNQYIYYRWIKGLVADVTFSYKRDADNNQFFFIEEVNVLNNKEMSKEIIHNCLEDEKRRLHEYIQRSEKSFISKLTDNSGYFATSHVNAFKIVNCVNTPGRMEIYLSTVGEYQKPVGYPYFMYKTAEYKKYKTGDIVKIDMKKITGLDLHTETPECWFYDISYLNEEDIEKGTAFVNLVNQYLY